VKKKFCLPFQNMTSEGWLNLALVAVFTFYILQIGNALINSSICQSLAPDYCAFYSAGEIINEHGFAEVYNLDLLAQYQKEFYNIDPKSLISFSPFPVVYLSIFLLPFKYLSLVSPSFSYLLWTLINLTVFILYIRFFTKEMIGHALPFRIHTLFLLSLPVFVNFFEGQVNTFLMILIGEFMRAVLLDKPYRAGAWLGGLLLKPQLLILIIPYLLIRGLRKIFLGFVASSFVIMVISVSLSKINGIFALKNLVLGFSKGLPTNNIPAMTNWRMLGERITSFTSSTIGWIIILIGSILTVTLLVTFFRKRVPKDPTKFAIAMLGIFAATCAVTWHAHLHMSMVLIPPMLYLIMKNRFNKKLFSLWVFVPILAQFIGYILVAYIEIENLPMNILQVLGFARGFPGFILNLSILGWAIAQYNHDRTEAAVEVLSMNGNNELNNT